MRVKNKTRKMNKKMKIIIRSAQKKKIFKIVIKYGWSLLKLFRQF